MRGDDRSSRYPPRGVWFGLMLAVGMVCALLAQDVPAEDDSRHLADPVVLAADRVTRWEAAGAIWVRLAGQASLLQPVEGVPRREAIARITDDSFGRRKISRVEIYAEGDVRVSGAAGSPCPAYRAEFRTTEVQLKCYRPGRADDGQRSALESGDHSPVRAAGGKAVRPANPHGARLSGNATAGARVPLVPALLAMPSRSARADASRRALPERCSDAGQNLLPLHVHRIFGWNGPQPRPDDPSHRRFASTPAAAAEGWRNDGDFPGRPAGSAGRGDPGASRGAGNHRRSTCRQSRLCRRCRSPGCRAIAKTCHRTWSRCPHPMDPWPYPSCRDGARLKEKAMKRRSLPTSGRADHRRFSHDKSVRSKRRQLQIVQLPTTPDGVKTYICRGGINIVSRTAKSGTIDIEADEAVIWRGPDRKQGEPTPGPNGETLVDDANQPMEVYLEGNVVVRQDQQKFAGKGDQRTVRAADCITTFSPSGWSPPMPKWTCSLHRCWHQSRSSRHGSSSFAGRPCCPTGRLSSRTSQRFAPIRRP